MEFIRLISGYRTALGDGLLVPDSPKHMAAEELYPASAGRKLDDLHKKSDAAELWGGGLPL